MIPPDRQVLCADRFRRNHAKVNVKLACVEQLYDFNVVKVYRCAASPFLLKDYRPVRVSASHGLLLHGSGSNRIKLHVVSRVRKSSGSCEGE